MVAQPLTTTGFESDKKNALVALVNENMTWHYRLRRIQDGTAKVAQKDCRLYTTGYDVADVPIFFYLKMELVTFWI